MLIQGTLGQEPYEQKLDFKSWFGSLTFVKKLEFVHIIVMVKDDIGPIVNVKLDTTIDWELSLWTSKIPQLPTKAKFQNDEDVNLKSSID